MLTPKDLPEAPRGITVAWYLQMPKITFNLCSHWSHWEGGACLLFARDYSLSYSCLSAVPKVSIDVCPFQG